AGAARVHLDRRHVRHATPADAAAVPLAGRPRLPTVGTRTPPASSTVGPVISPDPSEEAPGRGSPTLRHQARYSDFEPPWAEDEPARAAVERPIERSFGPIAWVSHEVASPVVHIDVHVVEPSSQRPFYTLVTSGMSDQPMTVPDKALEAGHHELAELMICLP